MTYLKPYEHYENNIAEAFMKKKQLITQPLLIHVKFSYDFWSHVVIRVAMLIRFHPTLLNDHSSIVVISTQS